MFRANWECGSQIVAAIFCYDKKIMFSVAPSPFHVSWNRYHGLHGNHHARLKHSVDVLAQLQLYEGEREREREREYVKDKNR